MKNKHYHEPEPQIHKDPSPPAKEVEADIVLPNIVLSDMQNIAVDNISKWYKKTPIKQFQIFYLAGYAGTGKSTIVPFAMKALGIKMSQVCFATYTGKAAMVLEEKSGIPTSTIHSLCYELVDDSIDPLTQLVTMEWTLRKSSPLRQAKLLVLDEVSMVNKEMMKDLMQFGVKILVLGDPFQLKPVEGEAYFHENYKPDYFLTQIHRQALENPIIMLSKRVREGKHIEHGHYGDSVIKLKRAEADASLYLQADQVIAGTNKTRRMLNNWFREEYGYTKVNSKFPVTGDKLINLRNDWSEGLYNGMIMKATANAVVDPHKESFKLSFEQDITSQKKLIFFDMACSSAEILNIKLTMPYWEQKKLLSIDYGYVITCHKAQGSQYNDVMFFDEGFGKWLPDNTYFRHLYTGITRAAEHLIIVD